MSHSFASGFTIHAVSTSCTCSPMGVTHLTSLLCCLRLQVLPKEPKPRVLAAASDALKQQAQQKPQAKKKQAKKQQAQQKPQAEQQQQQQAEQQPPAEQQQQAKKKKKGAAEPAAEPTAEQWEKDIRKAYGLAREAQLAALETGIKRIEELGKVSNGVHALFSLCDFLLLKGHVPF